MTKSYEIDIQIKKVKVLENELEYLQTKLENERRRLLEMKQNFCERLEQKIRKSIESPMNELKRMCTIENAQINVVDANVTLQTYPYHVDEDFSEACKNNRTFTYDGKDDILETYFKRVENEVVEKRLGKLVPKLKYIPI